MYKDQGIPVIRHRFDPTTKTLVETRSKDLFLRGPISMTWLSAAASLPGKTFHLAIAIQWLHGMATTSEFKLTGKALNLLSLSRYAAADGLKRLEALGLIKVNRQPGKRPLIRIATTAK